MGLYLDNGYLNFEYIYNKGYTFNVILSGRGPGKTYSSLQYMLHSDIRFIFMRRTQTQLNDVIVEQMSPFAQINKDEGRENPYVGFNPIAKSVYGIYDMHQDEDAKKPVPGKQYGYALALSTLYNLRGFSLIDSQVLILDEFIAEPHERELKEEGVALLNAYETINRNRELSGSNPLRMFLLGNANYFGGDIVLEMGLIEPITRMIQTGRTEWYDRQRDLGIWILLDSPISQRKKQTALYKFSTSKAFNQMALESKFADIFSEGVISRNLRDYKPVAQIGEIVVYLRKTRDKFYITTHVSGTPEKFSNTDEGWAQFAHKNRKLKLASLYGDVEYETNLLKLILTRHKVVI